MSSSSEAFRLSSSLPGRTKYFFLKSQDAAVQEYSPRLYFEAKIDMSDVRSGFRDTFSVNKAAEIHPLEDDELWTPDMVWNIDPAAIEPGIPQAHTIREIPSYLDAKVFSRLETLFVCYLMRYFEVRIFRNFALNLYSAPGENLEEFKVRCVEILSEAFRKELDTLHEISVRQLEQLRDKGYRERADLTPGTDFDIEKIDSQLKSKVHEVVEIMMNLVLETDLTLDGSLEAPACNSSLDDFDQRLSALEDNTRHKIRLLLSRYQEKVRTMDEYVIHANLKDIHVVRTCILWMPQGVQS